MKKVVWNLALCALIGVSVGGCGDDGPSSPSPVENSDPSPRPDDTGTRDPRTVLSDLRQGQIGEIHTCVRNYWRAAQYSYVNMSGGYLMQCLLRLTFLRESDLNLHFERDFMTLHRGLHTGAGVPAESVDAGLIHQNLQRGKRK